MLYYGFFFSNTLKQNGTTSAQGTELTSKLYSKYFFSSFPENAMYIFGIIMLTSIHKNQQDPVLTNRFWRKTNSNEDFKK